MKHIHGLYADALNKISNFKTIIH